MENEMKTIDRRGSAILAAAFAATLIAAPAAQAQGLNSQQAIDSIVQSDVREEETDAAADADKVIAAIEKSGENISAVRKVTVLDRMDIVFLPDATAVEGGPPDAIGAKLAEHEEEIDSMRAEMRGNAMLFHALDSRNILVEDVLAIEFDDNRGIVIYAAAEPPA
jgi:hypothetical protein